MLVWGRTGKAWRLGARDNRDLFSEVPRRVPCTSPPHVWALYGLRGDAFVPPARVEVLGTRPRQKLLLCARPKSARDCERISKLPVEKRLTNANSDAPPEVHQLSVATCRNAAGRETYSVMSMAMSMAGLLVRMHSSGRWNDVPTRRASGRESNSSERAAFRHTRLEPGLFF